MRGKGKKIKDTGSADRGWLLPPQLVPGSADQEQPVGMTSVCATAGAEKGHPGAAPHVHIQDQEERLRTQDRH